MEQNIDDSDANAFRYCGEYYDAEIGTIYLRARYYDPIIGRFISRDSYSGKNEDPLSLNLYTYCHNNPIIGIDPSGHYADTMGNFWSELQYLFSCIANTLSSYTSTYLGCGALAAADGPFPILDVVAAVAAICLTSYCVYEGVQVYNNTTTFPRTDTGIKWKSKSSSSVKDQIKDVAIDDVLDKKRSSQVNAVYLAVRNKTDIGTTIYVGNQITEEQAITILCSSSREGIYTPNKNYARYLSIKASLQAGGMGNVESHTRPEQLYKNQQQAHFHAVLYGGKEGSAHAWFGNLRTKKRK